MRLTTRGRYAVTALLDLALQTHSATNAQATTAAITLAEIAARRSISLAYLEQLFAKLKKQGLVVSSRGANGGYRLAKPAHSIAVLDIIAAVNESVDATRCDGHGNCQDGGMCLTHDLWHELSEKIEDYLSGITLGSLIDRRKVADPADPIASHVQPVVLRPFSAASNSTEPSLLSLSSVSS